MMAVFDECPQEGTIYSRIYEQKGQRAVILGRVGFRARCRTSEQFLITFRVLKTVRFRVVTEENDTIFGVGCTINNENPLIAEQWNAGLERVMRIFRGEEIDIEWKFKDGEWILKSEEDLMTCFIAYKAVYLEPTKRLQGTWRAEMTDTERSCQLRLIDI